MASMKDFLNTYYQRLIFNEMSYEQFVTFCEYIKGGNATSKQKDWAKKYLKKDATGKYTIDANTGLYEREDVPIPSDATEGLGDVTHTPEEWEKLYKAFRSTFQRMASSRDDLSDEAKKFLDEHFGATKVFQPAQITAVGKHKIENDLYPLLQNHKSVLEGRLKNAYPPVLSDDFTYQNLLDAIKDKKYQTDTDVRDRVMNAVSYVDGERMPLQAQYGVTVPNFTGYENWIDDSVQPDKLAAFAAECDSMLRKIRSDKKVREAFGSYDGGKITGPLNKALNDQKYDDANSEDYVQPKRYEKLSITEKIAEWCGDKYSDLFEKYAKLKGDALYFSDEAKLICKNLPDDLKKTDNLDTVLTALSKTKEKLTAKHQLNAIKHLEWFEKTMGELKNAKNMKKTYAGALQHGGQLRELVKEVMIKAVKESESDSSAIDKAKTTLEMLSVLHFGFTTSKIMDTIKDTDFSLFSDSKLSWNKNETMQFVTKALDRTVKFAFMGIGYGITMAKNAYSLSKTKIKSYSDEHGNLAGAHKDHLDINANKKQALENELNANRQLRTNTQTNLDTLQAGRSYADTELAFTTGISTNEANLNNITNAVNALKSALQAYYVNGGHPDIVDATELQNWLANVENGLAQATVPTTMPTHGVMVRNGLNAHVATIQNEWGNIQTYRTNLKTNQKNLNDLVNGKQIIDELNQRIPEQEAEFANWDTTHTDKMEELVKYWNMLETGRNTKTGPMYNWFRNLSQKNAEKRFANDRAGIIARYNASHSIAA
ncbi:MAG: hypothetical protein R8M71_03435 [Alphaproteobacteria bacterium]|nr:hypothetical protein [Alphaproteobacteria bacterium]